MLNRSPLIIIFIFIFISKSYAVHYSLGDLHEIRDIFLFSPYDFDHLKKVFSKFNYAEMVHHAEEGSFHRFAPMELAENKLFRIEKVMDMSPLDGKSMVPCNLVDYVLKSHEYLHKDYASLREEALKIMDEDLRNGYDPKNESRVTEDSEKKYSQIFTKINQIVNLLTHSVPQTFKEIDRVVTFKIKPSWEMAKAISGNFLNEKGALSIDRLQVNQGDVVDFHSGLAGYMNFISDPYYDNGVITLKRKMSALESCVESFDFKFEADINNLIDKKNVYFLKENAFEKIKSLKVEKKRIKNNFMFLSERNDPELIERLIKLADRREKLLKERRKNTVMLMFKKDTFISELENVDKKYWGLLHENLSFIKIIHCYDELKRVKKMIRERESYIRRLDALNNY